MVDLIVRVLDPRGRPVTGASVSIEQLRHAYPFDTAVVSSRLAGWRHEISVSLDNHPLSVRRLDLGEDGVISGLILFPAAPPRE